MGEMNDNLDRPSILITRETEKSAETARMVQAHGWNAIVFSTIETAPAADSLPLRDAIRCLGSFDFVVLPSKTAVAAMAEVAQELGLALADRPRPRFAAVGEGTAAALASLGIRDVVVPGVGRRDAHGLADTLCGLGLIGTHILIPRAEQGRKDLATRLRAAGASVTEVVAYRTVPRAVPDSEVEALLRGPRPDAALFMSPSAFRAFLQILGEDRTREFLCSAVLCAFGRTTARAMSDAGFPPHTIPTEPSVESALIAISDVLCAQDRSLARTNGRRPDQVQVVWKAEQVPDVGATPGLSGDHKRK